MAKSKYVRRRTFGGQRYHVGHIAETKSEAQKRATYFRKTYGHFARVTREGTDWYVWTT